MELRKSLLERFDLGDDFLRSLPAEVHVLAPEPLLRRLTARRSVAFSFGADARRIPASARVVLLAFVDDGPGARQAIARAHPRCSVLSLLNDLVPQRVLRRDPLDALKPANPPHKSYFLICPPRFGSTFIGDLMKGNGLGSPSEHLREPLATALQINARPQEMLDNLRRRGANANGVFGTKLISHFLELAATSPSAADALAAHFNDYDVGLRIRRDLASAVASYYVAVRRGRWHHRPALADEPDVPPMAWSSINFAYLHYLVEWFADQERFLDAWIAERMRVPVIDLDYRDFTGETFQTSAARRTIARYFGEPVAANFKLQSALAPADGDREIKRRIVGYLRERTETAG